MSDVRFCGPYLEEGRACRWLKGNHHGHTTRSDGHCTPDAEISAYRAAGYDYLALSEHDLFFDLRDDQTREGPLLLPAAEITSRMDQTLMFLGAGPDIPAKQRHSLAELARIAARQGAIFIVDHPNWLYKPGRHHVELDEIAACADVRHIEIYTGVIERLAGSPFALDVWDALLSIGRRVFGHAVDDQHGPSDRFKGWNCVQCPEDSRAATVSDVLEALDAGRFVASTGVDVHSIKTSCDGDRVLTTSDAHSIAWRCNGGRLVCRTGGGSGELAVADLLGCINVRSDLLDRGRIYLRIEYEGVGSERAWSQPFWLCPRGEDCRRF